MQKKKWKRPTIIVLARGEPEELVLVNCKTSGAGASGYDSNRADCIRQFSACGQGCNLIGGT